MGLCFSLHLCYQLFMGNDWYYETEMLHAYLSKQRHITAMKHNGCLIENMSMCFLHPISFTCR